MCVSFFLLTSGSGPAADEPRNPSQMPAPRVEIVPRPRTPAAATVDTPRANIRVDTTLVLIPVTVTDPLNRFVTGLEKEHFRLQEDNVEQSIAHFASEDAPLSVGIVFDTSGSMGGKLLKSRQAVAQFSRTANPEDEFFLVRFDNTPDAGDGFHPRHGRVAEQDPLH